MLVESGAGDGAWFPDSAYAEAGATIVSRDELLAAADAIVTVAKPDAGLLAGLRAGQVVFGLLAPLTNWKEAVPGIKEKVVILLRHLARGW